MIEQTEMSFADKIKVVQSYYNNNIRNNELIRKQLNMTKYSQIKSTNIDSIVEYIKNNNEQIKNYTELKDVVIALALESELDKDKVSNDEGLPYRQIEVNSNNPVELYIAYKKLYSDLGVLIERGFIIDESLVSENYINIKFPDYSNDVDFNDEFITTCKTMYDYTKSETAPKIIKYKYEKIPIFTKDNLTSFLNALKSADTEPKILSESDDMSKLGTKKNELLKKLLSKSKPQAGGRRSRRRRSRKSKPTRKNKKLTRRTRRK